MLRLLRRRHAEHLGDHPERQREGEVGDHVDLGARLRPRATAASSMSSTIACTRGASCSTIRGRERLLHQPAQAGVVGRIEVEDPPGAPLRPVAQDLLAHLGPGFGADHAAVLDAQRRVAQQPDGVVVAEQRPQAERRALHRVGGAELGVLRVRVLGEARVEGIERFRLTGHISHSGHQP